VTLLVVEVFQQVDVEVPQAVDHTLPCIATTIGVGQRAGRILDDLEQVGDPGVVGLQAVND